ncbi:MAG: hypothetical protein KBC94_06560 [Pseudacidovorax sp.]|uniref:hypothetical protein n=1 Tax=Pseudacidovorax sp. TaxID=1934311 RepID=UPI001B691F6F|nr:hypothetical protein [Pseudacidovorax sp.]MBP6894067.1 hypothetical protein [Pseudacidovorax sp.]
MPFSIRPALAALMAASLAMGCKEPPPQPTEAALALQAAGPDDIFEGVLNGQPVHLVIHDCAVYRIVSMQGAQVAWEQVLAPKPYYPGNILTSCQRHSLTADAQGVTAELGRMAFGAGGCCATGGTYRSRDGLNWTQTR